MRLPHLIHYDPDWQTDGIFAYHECRCGKRRLQWVNSRMYAPIPRGWPSLRDRHGVDVRDSGWQRVTAPPGPDAGEGT